MSMDVTLVPMELGDVPQVAEIDRQSFPLPWPARAYRYELTENSASQLLVALQAVHGRPALPREAIGYVGFWTVADEAHVSTIAVHPDHRGRGVGSLLVVGMLKKAASLGVTRVTLEVRPSNLVAQSLYRKYGFEAVGRRNRYYRDNGEDAVVMILEGLDEGACRERRQGACAR